MSCHFGLSKDGLFRQCACQNVVSPLLFPFLFSLWIAFYFSWASFLYLHCLVCFGNETLSKPVLLRMTVGNRKDSNTSAFYSCNCVFFMSFLKRGFQWISYCTLIAMTCRKWSIALCVCIYVCVTARACPLPYLLNCIKLFVKLFYSFNISNKYFSFCFWRNYFFFIKNVDVFLQANF